MATAHTTSFDPRPSRWRWPPASFWLASFDQLAAVERTPSSVCRWQVMLTVSLAGRSEDVSRRLGRRCEEVELFIPAFLHGQWMQALVTWTEWTEWTEYSSAPGWSLRARRLSQLCDPQAGGRWTCGKTRCYFQRINGPGMCKIPIQWGAREPQLPPESMASIPRFGG